MVVRSFVAVPLPTAVREQLAAAAARLATVPELASVKWLKKIENLHITIQFLGDVAEEALDRLGAALADGVRSIAPFPLLLRGIGAFPTAHRARVIWAGVATGADALERLAAAVNAITSQHGFIPDARAFRGHVTLGRAATQVDASAVTAQFRHEDLGSAVVDEVHLYESRLGRDGSTYTIRHRGLLSAAA